MPRHTGVRSPSPRHVCVRADLKRRKEEWGGWVLGPLPAYPSYEAACLGGDLKRRVVHELERSPVGGEDYARPARPFAAQPWSSSPSTSPPRWKKTRPSYLTIPTPHPLAINDPSARRPGRSTRS